MAEFIEREKAIDALHQHVVEPADDSVHKASYLAGYNAALEKAELYVIDITTADVRPERHGHIVWKERHSGGFKERKCLSDWGYSIFAPPCNRVARIDDRCTENRPYCSECGKLLGDFLSYCGNCGAKMDGKDGESNEQ